MVSLFVIVPGARAHDYNFVVSRDDAKQPRIYINGPSNYLDGSGGLDLLPGDGSLEGYWFNDAPGFSTMREDGAIRGRLHLRRGHRLAVRLIRHDPGVRFVNPSTWRPVLVDDGDTFEFVRDAGGDVSIQLITRADRPGDFSATLQFVDLAGLHADSAPLALKFGVAKTAAATHVIGRAMQANPRPLWRIALTAGGFFAGMLDPQSVQNGSVLSPDGHYHRAGRPAVRAASYPLAVADLRARLHDVDGWIAAGTFCNISTDADAMRFLIAGIPALAALPDSGVPASERDALARMVQSMVPVVEALITAANWSDPIGTRENARQLEALRDECERFVPRTYLCPMACEGQKTYSQQGKCPVCGMRLSDTRAHGDHNPKHGGTFFMTSDYLHHLEGVLTEVGEFRVYFYDEFTKPISPEAISARIEFWSPGGTAQRTRLRVDSAKARESGDGVTRKPSTDGMRRTAPPESAADTSAFLATIPLDIAAYPLRVRLLVDFPGGTKSQVFDFDFENPRRR